MRLLERHPIDESRLSRLCATNPDLSVIVELHVDLNVFDSTSLLTCLSPAEAVLVETPARPDILDPAEGFRGHLHHETTLQSLKRLKQCLLPHGQNLLDQWCANFSQCRVSVEAAGCTH